MQSRYGFLVLLLILVTGLALALSGGDGVFAGTSGGASKPPSGAMDAQQTQAAAQDAPSAPAPTPEPTRQAAAATPAGAPHVEPDQLLVQVVDGATGEPVADAEVAADDPKFRWDRLSPKEMREHNRSVDPFEQRKRWGQTAKSDAQGFAVIPRKGDSLGVYAVKDTRFGQLEVHGAAPANGWKLKLEPDQGIDIQVVDAAGKGLPEVPVGLTAEWIPPGATTGDQNEWVAGYTDEQGFARLRRMQMLARDWQERKPKDLRAYVAAIGLTSIFAPVTPACPAGPVVVLKVPAYGSARLKLTDRKQAPVPDSLAISLSLGADLPSQHPWDAMGMSEQVIGGIAEFRYLGLGITFHSSTWFNGVSIGKEFAGPRVQGEVTEVLMSLADAKVAHLHGRLVQPDGKPLVHADASLMDVAASDACGWFHTKEDGSFDWLGDAESLASVRTLMIVVHGQDDDDGEGRMPSASSAPIPMPAALDDVALGDVVVTKLKPLARGKVVAWTTPLPKHSLHIEVWQPGDGANEGSWNYSASYGVAQEKDGSFVVSALATTQPGRMRLSCSCEDAEPVTPFEFAAGQQDLRVELKRSAKLVVRVLLDPEVQKHVRMTGHLAGAGAELESWAQERDDAHVLEFSSLRAGDYQLQIKASDVTVVTIDNLHLVPGGPSDPRVDPLDLRGQLHSVQVRLINSAGTVADHWGQLRLRDARSGAWIESGYLEHGVANFGAIGSTLDLVVTGADFRPVRWQGPPGRIDLRVEDPFAVQIELSGLPADLPAESPLLVVSNLVGGSPLLREVGITNEGYSGGPDYSTPQKGILQRTCLEAGTYEVHLRWRVENGEDENLFTGRCELSPQQTRGRVVLPDDVQQRIRERLKKK